MPQQVQPITIFGDSSSGIIQSVKWNIAPSNSVAHAVNYVFAENFGEANTRKGSTITGSGQIVAGAQTVQSLHYFSTGSTTLAVVPNAGGTAQGVWYYNGTSWTISNITADTVNLKTRFASMMGVVVRLNATDTIKASADGITWGSSLVLDTANMPNGKFVIVYKAQMIIAGKTAKPDSLYISSVPNAGGTAISWTAGNREIVINPDDDAGHIAGFGQVNGILVVFKDRAMYTWNNHSTQADQVISVGCTSQESIRNFGGGLLSFFNDKGIWQTDSNQPMLISRRIQKWIDAIDPAYYPHVASHGDGDFLYTSIGDCTVDGTAYTNIVARYTVATKEWAIFSYANKFRVFGKYVTTAGAVQIFGGDTTARVLQIESSSKTDNGTSIGHQIETHDQDFGSRGVKKTISDQIVGIGTNTQGAIVQIKIDDGDWKTIGSMNTRVNYFKINDPISGHFFRFRVIGTTSGERVRLQGIELPKVTFLDYVG